MRWLGLLFPLVLAACSSESTPNTPTDTGPGDAGCVRYDGGPAVSLVPMDAGEDAPPTLPDTGPIVTKAEVDDIIKLSCSFSSCHGRAPGQGRLFLPSPETGNWVVEVVNKPSTAHPTMKRVVPGDPSNSFFVHKLTDGLCALNKECVGGTCGDRMPQGSDPLLKEDFDKIVRWIQQGANEK
jgi:hypothetical protein